MLRGMSAGRPGKEGAGGCVQAQGGKGKRVAP